LLSYRYRLRRNPHKQRRRLSPKRKRARRANPDALFAEWSNVSIQIPRQDGDTSRTPPIARAELRFQGRRHLGAWIWHVANCPGCGGKHTWGGGTHTSNPLDRLGLICSHRAFAVPADPMAVEMLIEKVTEAQNGR